MEAWRALGVPYEEATARTLVGQAQRVAGDEAAAAASFDAAVALFDQIGARLESRLVLDDTKRELPAGLTEREVEVLRLIAAGHDEQRDRRRAVPQHQDGVTPPVEHLHQDRRVHPRRRHRLRLRERPGPPPRLTRRRSGGSAGAQDGGRLHPAGGAGRYSGGQVADDQRDGGDQDEEPHGHRRVVDHADAAGQPAPDEPPGHQAEAHRRR